MHEINAQRKQKGIYHTLDQELWLDNERHGQYFRIDRNSFDHLITLSQPNAETSAILVIDQICDQLTNQMRTECEKA